MKVFIRFRQNIISEFNEITNAIKLNKELNKTKSMELKGRLCNAVVSVKNVTPSEYEYNVGIIMQQLIEEISNIINSMIESLEKEPMKITRNINLGYSNYILQTAKDMELPIAIYLYNGEFINAMNNYRDRIFNLAPTTRLREIVRLFNLRDNKIKKDFCKLMSRVYLNNEIEKDILQSIYDCLDDLEYTIVKAVYPNSKDLIKSYIEQLRHQVDYVLNYVLSDLNCRLENK